MILHVYKAEPDYRFYYDYSDIDVSKYELHKTIITNYTSVEDLIEAIEDKDLDFDFEETDLIELEPGIEELNDLHVQYKLGFKDNLNFLIVYGLGVKQIALDHSYFYENLGMKRLQSIF